MFGISAFSPTLSFLLSFLEVRNSVLQVWSALVGCMELQGVGRSGKSARSWRRSFHHTDQATVIDRAWPCGQPALGSPAWHTGPCLAHQPTASSLRQSPLSSAIALLLPEAGLGSANQTRAFPAGAGQPVASICWNRETLRGKAITKAFHCRQMLSVCADFSCF